LETDESSLEMPLNAVHSKMAISIRTGMAYEKRRSVPIIANSIAEKKAPAKNSNIHKAIICADPQSCPSTLCANRAA